MVDSQLTLDFLEQLEIPVKQHGKQPTDIAHSCQDCDVSQMDVKILYGSPHIETGLSSVSALEVGWVSEFGGSIFFLNVAMDFAVTEWLGPCMINQ